MSNQCYRIVVRSFNLIYESLHLVPIYLIESCKFIVVCEQHNYPVIRAILDFDLSR